MPTVKRERKKTKKQKLQDRPLTSNLKGYKSLQEKLKEIENQPHPIDTENPLKIYFFLYVWPIIQLAKNAVVSQNAHYKLPVKERIASSKAMMTNGLYGAPLPPWIKTGEEPPDVEEGQSSPEFKYTRDLKTSILKAFFSRYAWKTTYLIVLYILIQSQMFLKVYATKQVLEIIDEQLNDYGRLVDKTTILFWFAVIWLGNVFQQATFNFTWLDRNRLTMRLTGSLYSILYEKILRIGVVNYHEHDEGSIINYLQTDITKLENATWAVKHIMVCCLNLILSIFMGIVFFKWIFLVLVVGMFALCWVNSIIMKLWYVNENKWSKSVDQRLNLLKNVLRNLKSVKIEAMENVFLMKMNEKRAVEVTYLVKTRFYFVLLYLVSIMGNAGIIVSFLYFYFRTGLSLDVGSVTVLLRIFDLLQTSLFGIPDCVTTISDIFVSMRRLALFLESKEIEFNQVKQEIDHESKFAVEIKNGSFYWDKRVRMEEQGEGSV